MAVRHSLKDRPVDYGEGALQRLPQRVAKAGWRRLLLVCGRRSFEASGAATVLPALEQVTQVHRWSDFAPNTDSADLARGLEILRDVKADAVLAIGGGSAMDMAKLLCAYQDVFDADALRAAIRAGESVTQRRLGLHFVPTTSGSGSEATHFAVVYIGQEKFSVAGPALYADSVTLDPGLTLSGSAYQRATSGIDAVCQAIESLWAKGGTNTSRRLARHALRLLLAYIEPFVAEADPQAAKGMAIGSHLAGRAIDISKTTAAHALSYALTKGYGVSHGHAVALTLGQFIRAHAEAKAEDLQSGISERRHQEAMAAILKSLGARDAAEARDRFTALLARLGLVSRLRDIGLTNAEARRSVAQSVNVERLGNNPMVFTMAGLEAVLERAS